MKVKDLIELLKDYEDDAEVVLQGDDEGNYYKLLLGAQEDSYFGEDELDDLTAFRSQYSSVEDMASDLGRDVEEIEDFIEQLNDVVVLY